MLVRLLTLLLTIIAVPALAQQASPVAFVPQKTQIDFVQQKTLIDSFVQIADNFSLDHAVFNGRARIGRYRVECFYNTPAKEIVRAKFLFITDSLNFRKDYYFKSNSVIRISENDSAYYYQVGDHLINDKGAPVTPSYAKMLMGVIADTWSGLYSALFP